MSEINGFDIKDGVLVSYSGSDRRIVVPNGVIAIGDEAFNDGNIEEIVIPEGVTSIGESAFEDCAFLEKAVLPKSLTTLGWGAFRFCDGLTEITVHDGVTELPPAAFGGCEKLEKVVLPQGLRSVGGGAFQQCIALKELVLPKSLEKICGSCFAFCKSLTSIAVPSGVRTIGASAFEGCAQLQSVSLPIGVESLDDYCFKGCSKLKTVTYDGTVAQWEQIKKGKEWNADTSFTVVCSDGKTGVKNKDRKATIRDFADMGIKVKVTTVKDWKPLTGLKSSTAELIYIANHILAKRRIAYIITSFLLLAAIISGFCVLDIFDIGGFDIFTVVIYSVLVGLIFVFAISRWRRQLKSYKFFCSLYNFPPFTGFGSFMFGLARFVGFALSLIWVALSIIVTLIIAFIASSSSGGDFGAIIGFGAFTDRLGIPENIGQDEVIESGKEYDEAQAAIADRDFRAMLAHVENSIDTALINSDYETKNKELEKINSDIKELENHSYELSVEEKDKLAELKRKAEEKQSELDKSYQDAKDAARKNLDNALDEIKRS